MMSEYPLISCIMPTCGKRKRFVEQAVKLFNRQDYPNKELIVIDEWDDAGYVSIAALAQDDIHTITVDGDRPLTVGAKRNLACSLARGDLICSWDDDDYYGPERLSRQVEPILRGEADASALRMSHLFDAREGTLWACSDITHKLCFKQDIHYGTLLFKASYWRDGIPYASVQVGEDRRFVHALLARDVHIARIVDPHSFVYVLHGTNTTSDMRFVHPDGWEQVPLEQGIPTEEDRAFYHALAGGVSYGSR